MKRIVYHLLLCFLIVTTVACEKNCDCVGPGEFEYMVFGHFYGQCGGGEDCIEIFKLDKEGLYEDTTDIYPNSLAAYQGEYVLLPDAKFQLVKDLVIEFPDELYAETNNVIGMPDFADGGGIYVEMKFKNGEAMSGFWLLDQYHGNMPQVYNEFVDKINEKIALINQ